MKRNIKNIINIVNIKKRTLFLGIIFSLLGTLASLSLPLILKNIIDSLINKNFNIYLVIFLCSLAIFDIIFAGMSIYLLSKVGEEVVLGLRKKIWLKILNSKSDFFEHNSQGELVSRIMDDTKKLMDIFSTDASDFVTGLFTLIGTVVILMTIDPLLTALIFISIPIIVLIVIPLGKSLYKFSIKIQENNAIASEYIVDRVSNIKLIKMSNTLFEELYSGIELFRNIYKINMNRNKIQSVVLPIITLTITSTIIGIVFFGAFRVINGALSPGALFAFVVYIVQVTGPLITILTFWNKLNTAIGSSDRIIDILNYLEEDNIENIEKDSNYSIDYLALDHINFSIDDTKIIKDFSYIFKKGNFYNLLGYSGSGKTTIFNIICKFITPDTGSLYTNHTNNYNIYAWRENISYVSQDISIINGTLKENILYGVKQSYSDEFLLALLQEIGLKKLLKQLPDGLNTKISKNSSLLSGGEKQRIALLRGCLSDKQILLVDEVSSNVDSKNDFRIYSFLKNHNDNKIIIMITHKLSNINNEDPILLLENGKLIASGLKNEVSKSSSLFKELENYYRGNINNEYLMSQD
ncbi:MULTISPECIES: ABC transporter ATP-binding protein [Lactococcus]|uniref:Garvicin KS ABC transporter n=1 Tax=Lactococcus garvieae TaxID=1363 RepID=A0A1B0Z2Q3_9LACT|nr:ABC transporter ATP-binding protein [Lactococcus lactis]ANO58553.1 garvicin KS ABC transporter [Lactococcus garvieae]PST73172.1 hypothetical protein AEH57_00685 [Lactococcus garvieae]TYR21170.1 ABC transporter ATP-binding protein [Lactococcus lactis subsp. lactis bv. diacetylactis]